MSNYRDFLSDTQIQDIFAKLQSLSADYISFEDFVSNYCIVNFKQTYGEHFKSGSILIDVNGNIKSIHINNSILCNGFESIKKGTEGSSLLKLRRILDNNGQPTKYIHYSISLSKSRYNGGRCVEIEEGVYNTKKDWNAGCIYSYMQNINVTAYPQDLLLINYIDKNGEQKFGIIDDNIQGWNNGKWLIAPNFSFIEIKNDKILLYDKYDIEHGTHQIYEKQNPQYEFIKNGDFFNIKGNIIRSKEQIITFGSYAGKKVREISWLDMEEFIKHYAFFTNESLEESSDIDWAYRDSILIETPISIETKEQLIDYKLPTFRDKNNNIVDVSLLVRGTSFEDAYINHNEYVNYLIKKNNIIVKPIVFTMMLEEEYALRELEITNNFEVKSKNIKELILESRDNINSILSSEQINNILEHINSKYSISDESKDEIEQLNYTFNGEVCVIDFSSDDYYEHNEHAILVTRIGDFFDDDFSKLIIINDDLIIYQKDELEYFCNKDNPSYEKTYEVIKEQGIIDCKGKMIYKGDFGNLDDVKCCENYLLLQKEKFTQIEKDKITYYLENHIDSNSSKEEVYSCDECGGCAYWSEYEECYVCEDCGEKIHEERGYQERDEEWFLSPIQLLRSDDYEDVLNSQEIKDGLFINEDDYYEDDFEDYMSDFGYDTNHCVEKEDYHLDEVLYSMYSIDMNKIVIPFQPCRIFVNPPGAERGIYLGNKYDLEITKYGIKYEKKLRPVESQVTSLPFSNRIIPIYERFKSQIFLTIFDTFRSGEFTGKTLSSVFKENIKELKKLVFGNNIFIATNALKQLNQKYCNSHKEEILQLIRLRDQKLCYTEDILYSCEEIANGQAAYYGKSPFFEHLIPVEQEIFYNGKSYKQVFSHDPKYLIGLVNNMIIRVDSCFINGIDKAAPFYEQLKKAIDYNVECQEEEQKARWEEEQAAWEREEQRYYTNEGYWDAFDGDPEAYWNID